MAVDTEGIVHLIIISLAENVFGSILLTCVLITMFFLLFSLIIRIPVPFAFALQIPFVVYLTAWGYMPILIGGLMSAIFLVFAVTSMTAGFGIK